MLHRIIIIVRVSDQESRLLPASLAQIWMMKSLTERTPRSPEHIVVESETVLQQDGVEHPSDRLGYCAFGCTSRRHW